MLAVLAERTRATERIAPTFQPPHAGIIQEAGARQHQLVVGRRGVGKSMLLLNVVSQARANEQLIVYIDLESYRGIPYPDVLIRLLAELAMKLAAQLRRESRWKTWPLRRRIGQLRKSLQGLLAAPQEERATVVTESAKESQVQDSAEARAMGDSRYVGMRIGSKRSRATRDATETVNTAEFVRTKMEGLQAAAPEFRTMLGQAVQTLAGQRAMVVLDDFYFIPRADQPEVLSYLH